MSATAPFQEFTLHQACTYAELEIMRSMMDESGNNYTRARLTELLLQAREQFAWLKFVSIAKALTARVVTVEQPNGHLWGTYTVLRVTRKCTAEEATSGAIVVLLCKNVGSDPFRVPVFRETRLRIEPDEHVVA